MCVFILEREKERGEREREEREKERERKRGERETLKQRVTCNNIYLCSAHFYYLLDWHQKYFDNKIPLRVSDGD